MSKYRLIQISDATGEYEAVYFLDEDNSDDGKPEGFGSPAGGQTMNADTEAIEAVAVALRESAEPKKLPEPTVSPSKPERSDSTGEHAE